MISYFSVVNLIVSCKYLFINDNMICFMNTANS